ncbi:MAG: dipeptide epimerase [Defluviitaleaceae bacterium]|nr:dipeptide epimerase [Defluviitaleaceae bacterium]
MIIKSIEIKKVNIPLIKPFKTAKRIATHTKSIIVIIKTDTEHIGYGEAASTPVITGETLDSCFYAIKNYIMPAILNLNIANIEEIIGNIQNSILHNTSAKAAVDMAIYDLYAKFYNVPLYQILGGSKKVLKTDITISIDSIENMIDESLKYANLGYDTLKIKVGTDCVDDFEKIKKISEAIGKHISLRIDANQGWTAKDAVRIIKKIEDLELNINFIEQPVHYKDYKGMAYVTKNTYLPICADESVFSARDTIDILEMRAADIINIKLMKSAGIYNALQICKTAKIYGIECMVGCMLETNVGATFAANFAASQSNVKFIDIDTPMFYKKQCAIGGISTDKNEIMLQNEIGSGIIDINQNFIF